MLQRTQWAIGALVICCACWCGAPTAWAASAPVQAEAFLDDPSLPPGMGTPLPLEAGETDAFRSARGALDLSGVAPGARTLYVRFRDDDGVWSEPVGQTFHVRESSPSGWLADGPSHIVAAEAFIGNDPGEGNGVSLPVSRDGAIDSPAEALRGLLSTTGLGPGPQVLSVRFLDRTNIWSPVTAQTFSLAGPITGPGGPLRLIGADASIDGGSWFGLVADDGAFDDLVETVTLAETVAPGYHSVRIRFRDSSGQFGYSHRTDGQEAPPDTPVVAGISPGIIAQGNSYQYVTLSGSNFGPASWHQFSIDGGVTWFPAQSAPEIISATSMRVAVNNTLVRTVQIRVCASFGSTSCSDSVWVTIEAATSAITPVVHRAVPDRIVQGTGFQNVRLDGTAFALGNRYQTSINNGAWSWSASAPTVHSPTSMTVGVPNTALGSVRIRVCTAQGSTDCSTSTTVSVEPVPVGVPSITSIDPESLMQGASDLAPVGIVGTNFTASSWHQFSVDGGSSWGWAEEAPQIHSPATMTVKVSDRVARTLQIRVCAAHLPGTACSAASTLTIRAVEREPDPILPPSSATKAVVITHGWNSDAPTWVQEMTHAVCRDLGFIGPFPSVAAQEKAGEGKYTRVCSAFSGSVWDVWAIDWRSDAKRFQTLSDGLVRFPKGAFDAAKGIGEKFANAINEHHEYKHIHLIAHSAGSNLIEAAAGNFRKNSEKLGHSVTIHQTFLDPYKPGAGGPLIVSDDDYGQHSTWSDSYVDLRRPPKLHVKNAFTIDVTGSFTACNFLVETYFWPCAHSRPYRFYGQSIESGFIGDVSYEGSYESQDPIEGLTAGMGFRLSVERGTSLQRLKDLYPTGGFCEVSGDICYDGGKPGGTLHHLPAAIGETLVDAKQGAVDFLKGTAAKSNQLFQSLKLRATSVLGSSSDPLLLAMSGTTDPSMEPAYLMLSVVTTEVTDLLRFDWSFEEEGDGLLRIFVNGELVRSIQQRHVADQSFVTEEVYLGTGAEGLPPGTHEIAFRLDGFGESPSGVVLTNVELLATVIKIEGGQVLDDLAGTSGSVQSFVYDVPEGSGRVTIQISGGTGDVDLGVRLGAPPTGNEYDCYQSGSGPEKTCVIENPQAGTYFISLVGVTDFSGVTLEATTDALPGYTCSAGEDFILTFGPQPGATLEVQGCRTITVEAGATVPATGTLALRASERIRFRPGFRVESGGRLTAAMGAGTLSMSTLSSEDAAETTVLTVASTEEPTGSTQSSGTLTPQTFDAAGSDGTATTSTSAFDDTEPATTLDLASLCAAPPAEFAAVAGDQSVQLTWSAVPEGDGYQAYWSLTPGIHPYTAASYLGFAEVQELAHAFTGLENDQEHYFVVTVTCGSDESPPSVEVTATPRAGPPLLAGRYRLEDVAEGTVEDVATGLQWMRCALGQRWDGGTCVGYGDGHTYESAPQAADRLNEGGGYAGFRDWRVPTLGELQGLVYCSSGVPAFFKGSDSSICQGSHGIPMLEPEVFPASSAQEGWFWSATPADPAGYQAWGVDFTRGDSHAYPGTVRSGVRLVRDVNIGDVE